MILFFSDIDKALIRMQFEMKFTRRKLFLCWTRHGKNAAEFRVCTSDQVIKNTAYALYESEKGMIKKNVKPFNFLRKWTTNK